MTSEERGEGVMSTKAEKTNDDFNEFKLYDELDSESPTAATKDLCASAEISEDKYPVGITNIENLGLEALVLEWVLKDHPPAEISRRLTELYPEERFPVEDVRKFIERNRAITSAIIQSDRKLVRRHMETNFAFRDKLMKLQGIVENSLEEAAGEREYSAVASLQNSILKNIHLFAKLGGLLDPEKNSISINFGSQVANLSQEDADRARERLLSGVGSISINDELSGEEPKKVDDVD